MTNYVALFRGINVGGNNILPMKDLKKTMSDQGFENVQSYIQSGNVVFSSESDSTDKLSDGLSALVMQVFGFQPKVMLLNEQNFRQKAALCPFDMSEGKIVHLYFLSEPPSSPDTDTLHGLKRDSEEWQIQDDMFFLRAPDGIGRSKLAEKVEKCLGVAATARNGNTVIKLLGMLDKMRGASGKAIHAF